MLAVACNKIGIFFAECDFVEYTIVFVRHRRIVTNTLGIDTVLKYVIDRLPYLFWGEWEFASAQHILVFGYNLIIIKWRKSTLTQNLNQLICGSKIVFRQ